MNMGVSEENRETKKYKDSDESLIYLLVTYALFLIPWDLIAAPKFWLGIGVLAVALILVLSVSSPF